MKRIAALLFGLVPSLALAAISLTLAVNSDLTRSTAYPSGNKPIGGCTTPAGWTAVSLGDGGGEICGISASEFSLSVFGTSQTQNNRLVHKSGGSGDVQVVARITNTYAGSTENNASTGIGIREAATQASYLFQCHSLQNGATAVQLTYGAAGTYTSVNGAAGQARPRYVAVTYDLSSGDLKCHESANGSTWTEVGSSNRALSAAVVYVFGASKSAVTTLQATIDNIAVGSTINVYTPADPPGGSVPTLVTPIANQSAAQGTALSLSVAANFSGQISYTATGFPGAGGFTFSTVTGAVAGTPDSDDVAASPFNVTFCAVNVTGSTCDVAQFTVSAVPGDTLAIAAGTATVDCDTYESGGLVDPGDILQIAGGIRGPLTIRDCHGTASNPIIIRNDITDNEPAIIRKSGAGSAVFVISNSSHWVLDGTGKYVGADTGVLGIDPTTLARGLTQYGILVDKTGGAAAASHMLRINELSTQFIVKGVKIDGGAAGATICFSLNDHAYKAATYPGVFREDILFTNNYGVNCGSAGGVGMYIGPNGDELDIPLKNIEVAYNIVETTGFDCLTLKGTYTGTNSIHHNHFSSCTVSTVDPHGTGIDLQNGGNVSIYSNKVMDADDFGIRFTQSSPPTGFSRSVDIYNNIIVRTGREGINLSSQPASFTYSPATIYNNTLIEATGCIAANANVTATARDNICAGSAAQQLISGVSDSNNRKGTVASQNFVNAGADNYELSATSPACNNSTANAPALDYEDEVRPMDSADDQGADEAAACP